MVYQYVIRPIWCMDIRYGQFGKNVPCLPSVTGFSSKLVFNLAEHPTLL